MARSILNGGFRIRRVLCLSIALLASMASRTALADLHCGALASVQAAALLTDVQTSPLRVNEVIETSALEAIAPAAFSSAARPGMDTLVREPWTVAYVLASQDRQEVRHQFDGRGVTQMTGGRMAAGPAEPVSSAVLMLPEIGVALPLTGIYAGLRF